MKALKRIQFTIDCQPVAGVWEVSMSADLTVSVEEHPEFERRKGIAVNLTPQQETTILNFIRNVVVPQAEAGK